MRHVPILRKRQPYETRVEILGGAAMLFLATVYVTVCLITTAFVLAKEFEFRKR